jgi:hypothetical protein
LTFNWTFEAPQAAHLDSSKMMTFSAPGTILSDGGVVTLVNELPKGGVKLNINVDDMQVAMDVSFNFQLSTFKGGTGILGL